MSILNQSKHTVQTADNSAASPLKFFNNLLRDSGVALALVLLIVAFSVMSPLFLTQANINNIFTQIAINVIYRWAP
jgi:predicted ABC-type sugar transport system permease subunit